MELFDGILESLRLLCEKMKEGVVENKLGGLPALGG